MLHMHDTFPARLGRLRKAKGLSQAALSAAAGLSVNSVGNYERGVKTPSIAVCARLAEALGVGVAALADPDPVGTAIRIIVDGAPPLSPEQVTRLRRVLAGA